MEIKLIHINETVIVEGKYDKIKLMSVIDAVIIKTDGFSIFKDKEKLALIRSLAEKTGILIMTDSDAAGFKIRHFLEGALPKGTVKHAYIPDIPGKESRKSTPSKEGKLGVEGIPVKALMESLERAGVFYEQLQNGAGKRLVTKADLFEDGFSGGRDSSVKRRTLLKQLNLPQRLSANGLLDVINTMYSYEEYKNAIRQMPENQIPEE